METDGEASAPMVDRVGETDCPHCGARIDVSGLEPFHHAECPHCARTLSVPGRLGAFLLLDAIGAGGMGSVYRARDEALGRIVAIKVMLPSLGEDADFVATFKREAQAAAKLNHPHIAQIYSFGQEHGQPYIVMELVPGSGLDKLIESGKPLKPAMVMQIGLDIAEGLQEADEIGLIHGDIKPENILLDDKMNAKLVDFGIASVAGQASPEGIWGTPYYIAPEKIRRQKIDARSDIYCLGATLYHALSGHPPFEGETPVDVVKARLDHEPPPLRTVRPDIPEAVEQIIIRMLKTDPAQRYPTYASLIGDMTRVVQQLNPTGERTRKSRKIMIRKKSASTTGGPFVAVTAPPPVEIAVEGNLPGAEKQGLSSEERARRRSALLVVLWIFIGLALVLSAIGGGVYYKLRRDRQIAARRLQLALTSERGAMDRNFAGLQATLARLVSLEAQTPGIMAQVTNIVSTVLEEPADDLIERLHRESPVYTPPAPPMAAATNVPATVATNVAAAGAAAGVGAGTNAAVGSGSATNQALAVDGPVTNDVADAVAPPVAEESAPAMPIPPMAEEAAAPEPEIRTLANTVLAKVLAVRQCVVNARTSEANARGIYERAMTLQDLKAAAEGGIGLSEALAAVQLQESNAAKALDSIRPTLVSMEEMKRKALGDRAAAEQARIDAERRNQEALARQQAEAEHQALVTEEMATVKAAAAACMPFLKQQQYQEAARQLTAQRQTLKTPEAGDAMQIVIDRYNYLHELRSFLAQQLGLQPLKWGWIQAGSPEDILGATATHVKLKARLVPWREVGTRQMVHLIRYYVQRNNRSVPLKELARQALAAAIFCYENGGYEMAADFRIKAGEFDRFLAEDIERLVPASPPEPEPEPVPAPAPAAAL